MVESPAELADLHDDVEIVILPLHFMFRIRRYGWKPFCASMPLELNC